MEAFARADLDRALQRRSVVQGTLMRTMIHLVSTRDYWPFALGVRRARREWWLRIQKGTIDGATMQRRARRLRRLLADGPCTANEVKLLARDTSDCGSTSSVFLRPGPGSGDAPTCSPPPRTGSARTARRRHRASSVSCSATSEPSGRQRLLTSPAGPECVRDISCPFSSASGYGASGTKEVAS